MADVLVLLMGGTIDSSFDSTKDTIACNEHSAIPNYFSFLKTFDDVEYVELAMKDSRELTMEDRVEMLERIEATESKRVLITHGTYTMPDTGRFLQANLQRNDQTIVFTGSMIPLVGFIPSDAPFNLGYAWSQLQVLNPGVHVCMNGHTFSPDEILKLLSDGKFTSIFTRVPLNSN